MRRTELNRVIGGPHKSARLLPVYDGLDHADKHQPVAAVQALSWRDGRQQIATAFDLDREQLRQVAQACLFDGLSYQRSTGLHGHLHGILPRIFVDRDRRPPIGQ